MHSTFRSGTLSRCVFNHLSLRLRSPGRAAPHLTLWPAPRSAGPAGALPPLQAGVRAACPSHGRSLPAALLDAPPHPRGGLNQQTLGREPAGASGFPQDPGLPPGLTDGLMGVCSLTQGEELSQAKGLVAAGWRGGVASRTGGCAGSESHWRGGHQGWGVAEASLSGLAHVPERGKDKAPPPFSPLRLLLPALSLHLSLDAGLDPHARVCQTSRLSIRNTSLRAPSHTGSSRPLRHLQGSPDSVTRATAGQAGSLVQRGLVPRPGRPRAGLGIRLACCSGRASSGTDVLSSRPQKSPASHRFSGITTQGMEMAVGGVPKGPGGPGSRKPGCVPSLLLAGLQEGGGAASQPH